MLVVFGCKIGLNLECQADSHTLQKLASVLYARRFVFLGYVSVKADGYAYSRLLYDFLLGFIFEKLRYVIVRFKRVQAVVIHVQFPKNSVLRHLLKIAAGVFVLRLYKRKHIGMRYADGATATAGKSEQIAFGDRARIVQVFHQTKIKEGNIRFVGQSVAVLAVVKGAYFNPAKDFDFLCVFVAKQTHMVVIALQGLAVVGVELCTLLPTKIRPRTAYTVVVVANTELLDATCNDRFYHFFGFILRTKGIVGVGM